METEREAFALEKAGANERQRKGPHVCTWTRNACMERHRVRCCCSSINTEYQALLLNNTQNTPLINPPKQIELIKKNGMDNVTLSSSYPLFCKDKSFFKSCQDYAHNKYLASLWFCPLPLKPYWHSTTYSDCFVTGISPAFSSVINRYWFVLGMLLLTELTFLARSSLFKILISK